ncbi:glutathione S-transferase family protein [Aurantiacibacter zhengii]|uniref:Glutathione S-transferase family protein n=2 Tax=Aurantiacibacter zhengii TaxID=2307003 RepID=A0A418NQE7_9SPHN|nr:glutathione S-transferase family protein [Aurantiacibacter zhengii]
MTNANASITITAFANSPDKGEGHARDMRVRWALEEVGESYSVRLLSFDELKTSSYLVIHPFGKIPAFEQDDLVLFESGAIVQHIACKYRGLLPPDANARERAIMWLFAALNTVEPPIVEREAFMLLERDKPWFGERLNILDDNVRMRLQELSDWLGDAEWLEDSFTVGDLMMVMVVRRLEDAGQYLFDEFPTIAAYVARGEARPAYQRAFADQRAVFLDSESVSAGSE